MEGPPDASTLASWQSAAFASVSSLASVASAASASAASVSAASASLRHGDLSSTSSRPKILSLLSYILFLWACTPIRGVAAQQTSTLNTQSDSSATVILTAARTTFTVVTQTPTFTVVVDGSSTTTNSEVTTTNFYSSTLTTETAAGIGATRTFWLPVSISQGVAATTILATTTVVQPNGKPTTFVTSVTPSNSATPSASPGGSKKAGGVNIAIVVGSVVPAAAILTVFLIWFFRRRRKNKGKEPEQDDQKGGIGLERVKAWVHKTDSTPPPAPPPSVATHNSIPTTLPPEYRSTTSSPPPIFASPTSAKRGMQAWVPAGNPVRAESLPRDMQAWEPAGSPVRTESLPREMLAWVPAGNPVRAESLPSSTLDDNRQSAQATTIGGLRRHFDEESSIAPSTAGRTPWSIIEKPISPTGIKPRPFSPIRYAHYDDDDDDEEPYPAQGATELDRRDSFGTVHAEPTMRDQKDTPDREHDDGRSLTPQPLRVPMRNVSDPTYSHQAPSTVENLINEYRRTGNESIWSDGRIESDRERTQRIMEGRKTWTSSVYTADTRGNPRPAQEDRPPLTDEMVAQMEDHIKGRNREHGADADAGEGGVDWDKLHGEFK